MWNVFQETGDPIGYLLYKADDKGREKKTSAREKKRQKQGSGGTPASL